MKMFTVKDGDRIYEVEFEYLRDNFNQIAATICYINWISNLGDKRFHSVAKAIVHPQETPNKNIGRKISLHRALNTAFTKNSRKLFWEAYYNARGGKW